MAMYKYYALIEKDQVDDSGAYLVSFPDIEECFTDSETLIGAVSMAQDVLESMLSVFEDDGDVIPAPSKPEDINVPDGASLVMITVDTSDIADESPQAVL